MPEDVKALYLKLLKEGKTAKEAAREAQERTGFSVVTGQPIRTDTLRKKEYRGQY